MQKIESKRVLDFLGVKLVLGRDLSRMSKYRIYDLDRNALYICSSRTGYLLWTYKKPLNENDAAMFLLKQKCWLDAKGKLGTPDFMKTVNISNKLFGCKSIEEALVKIDLLGDKEEV